MAAFSRMTYSSLNLMLNKYHNDRFMEIYVLGTSFSGREIALCRIGNGKRRFLYVGAHHGAEGITSSVLMRFLGELLEILSLGGKVAGVDRDVFLNSVCLDVVPMLNPDGVEISAAGVPKDDVMYDRLVKMNGGSDDFSLWQANARGVDLNHNYNAGFSEYKKIEAENGIFGGCPSKYSGEYPESEPETAALCAYIRSEKPQSIITLHSQGEEIYFSRGKSAPAAYRNAKIASKLTGYALSEPEGTALYGGLLDWAGSIIGIPTLTVECGKGRNPLPESDLAGIYVRLRDLLFSSPFTFAPPGE